MKRVLIVFLILITSQIHAQERSWQCVGKDDKELIRLDKTVPCPVGFRAYELDSQGNIVPNGYDPLANQKFVRCIGINKVVIYKKEDCLMQKALGWMKGQPIEVNREGFTLEEARIEAKRRENLAKQKEWENRHKKTPNQPKVSKLLNPDELVELRGFEIIKSDAKQIKKDDCKSWMNSNVIDPTPEKKKYIKEHC